MSSIPGPKTKFYQEKALKLFPGGARPEASTFIDTYITFVVDRAEGDYLYDVDGNAIIDFSSGWASNNVGNVHPEVLDAVINALKKYGFVYNHVLAFELAEKLVEITPPELTRVRFEVSGTEAAEAAVSFALTYTKRPLIISFMGQYHGDSIGARMIGALDGERKRYFEAYMGGVLFAPYPVSYGNPMLLKMTPEEYADYVLWFIEDQLLEHIATPDRIAGILFEPMMAEGGNYIPPKRFIEGLRKMADKYGWVLLCDEVLTGFGRTGKFWAIEHYNVPVDLIVTAKGLTGGLIPIGAIIGSEKMMAETVAFSGSTFAGCPAGCAAALKTIEIIYRDNLLERTTKLGEEALKIMKEWVDKYEIVGDARGVGFLLGFTLVKDKDKQLTDVELARKVYVEASKMGVRAIWDDEPHVRIYPPLNIREEALFKGLEIIEKAIKKVQAEAKVGTSTTGS